MGTCIARATGFTVTPLIAVTAPIGAGSYAAGDRLTVSRTTSSAAASGEFGVWARSAAGAWYIGKLVPAGGGGGFTTALTLEVPAGTGYQAIVAYILRPGDPGYDANVQHRLIAAEADQSDGIQWYNSL